MKKCISEPDVMPISPSHAIPLVDAGRRRRLGGIRVCRRILDVIKAVAEDMEEDFRLKVVCIEIARARDFHSVSTEERRRGLELIEN